MQDTQQTIKQTLFLKTGYDGLLNPILHFPRELFSLLGSLVLLNGGEHSGRLLSSHDTDARVGPHVEEVGTVCSPTHAVVA